MSQLYPSGRYQTCGHMARAWVPVGSLLTRACAVWTSQTDCRSKQHRRPQLCLPLKATEEHVTQSGNSCYCAPLQAHDLQASGQDLQRAAEAVVPSWDEDSAYLILPLPSALAHVWARIRLEVGGVMLPPALTERWRVAHVQKHGQGQGAPYCIKGMYWDVKGWLSGAQLLTCSARMCDEQPDQWELVVRVRWPPAPGLYEKVSTHQTGYVCCASRGDAHGYTQHLVLLR
jgi:hypothetical protein